MLERRFVMHLFWVENVFNMAKFCEICRDDLTILALKGRKPEICWTIALRPCKIIDIFTSIEIGEGSYSRREKGVNKRPLWDIWQTFCAFLATLVRFFERPLIFAVIAIKSFRYGQHFDETVYIVDTSRKLLRDLDEDYVDNCKKRKKNLLRDVDNFSTLSNY